MKYLKKWIIPVSFTLGGAAVGLFLSQSPLCINGNCRILGSPLLSAAYVGVIGLLISSLIPRKKEQ